MEVKADIDFVQLVKDVACIKQAVIGNGQPGLCKRVENLEKNERSQGRIVGMCSGIGFIVGAAFDYLLKLFRG